MRAWEDFLTLQEKELGGPVVDKWLRPLKLVRFDACNLYLEAQDSFRAVWFEEHMRHRVESLLCNNNRKKIKVHLSVGTHDKSGEKKLKKRPHQEISPPFKLTFDEVNDDSSFESFITCQGNLLAYKLLKETCAPESNSLTFNPIYLFGRPGSGKTHLMMATAAALTKKGSRTIYLRASTFTEHVVSAIRSGEMQHFRKVYRSAHALLIDDIEIFSRKGATQEELFHTFNTLHTEGKQIILSARCPPQELKFIEPRLVSRFEWGIVIPLQNLESEQMRTVLIQRARRVGFPLDESVIEFLITTFSQNTKGLIRALEALILRTHLNHKSIDTPLPIHLAKKYLADLIEEEEKAILTPSKIIRTVADYFGIKIDDILSKSQSREHALPRQIAMHLCRDMLSLPFMKIGDLFARDHSTVQASVKLVQKSLEEKQQEITGSLFGILKKLDMQ